MSTAVEPETAEAVPRSPVSVEVTARGHKVLQDKPEGSGGEDRGMMASELLLASLLACQHSTFVKVAERRSVHAAIRKIEGGVHFDERGDIGEIRIHFLLEAPLAVPDSQILQVCRLTDKACTISKALGVPVQWSYERSTASAPEASASSR